MYEIVTTQHQKELFDSIWQEVWEEKGYEVEQTENTISQLLLKENENYVGTVEFKKLTDSESQNAFDFEAFPLLQRDYTTIVEIDKLAVAKGYRKISTLRNILSTIVYFSKESDIPWLVALIEPQLYAVVSRHFWGDVQKLGPAFYYKGDNVIPICIDASVQTPTKKEYPWLVENTTLIEAK
jgi:hypothetical protein